MNMNKSTSLNGGQGYVPHSGPANTDDIYRQLQREAYLSNAEVGRKMTEQELLNEKLRSFIAMAFTTTGNPADVPLTQHGVYKGTRIVKNVAGFDVETCLIPQIAYKQHGKNMSWQEFSENFNISDYHMNLKMVEETEVFTAYLGAGTEKTLHRVWCSLDTCSLPVQVVGTAHNYCDLESRTNISFDLFVTFKIEWSRTEPDTVLIKVLSESTKLGDEKDKYRIVSKVKYSEPEKFQEFFKGNWYQHIQNVLS